jgi:hypothetical protein
MLQAARAFVRERQVTSAHDLALHLDTTKEVAAALLAKWVAKGQIEAINTACSNCNLCHGPAPQFYRWAGTSQATPGATDRSPAQCPGPDRPQRALGRNSTLPITCSSAGPPQGQ